MIFTGETCVKWAQVKSSGTMHGGGWPGEVGWVGDVGMDDNCMDCVCENDVLECSWLDERRWE